ncbi:glutathione-disulfide reductase [uncultured Rhodoferax sp.]|uniref:glutathione-disulfide reductase n=1 Tax=uncultured Rhodoferax sp. TaxID=223188 RepID=UPI0025DD2D73|nr:glutathione-disulfide reductase [uncultured Rhodoferax sp.]
MEQFDLIVIGGGSGGVRAARIAANHGARVALVEEYRMGGTCVIRGCVPKKLMVYASRFAQEFEEAAGFGWLVQDAPRLDWALLKTRRDAEVTRLEGIYRSNLVKAGVQILEGRATLIDRQTVALSDGRRYQAQHILIATGAQPASGPDIPGHELAIDSNGFFELPALPRRVVVQGAGYIALELACVLQRLGAEVTVVVRGPQILRGFDDELRAHLAEEMARDGLQFRFGREVRALARTGDGTLQVQLDHGDTLVADCVLRALGRVPNTQGLGLEAAGIALDAQGAIPVDAFSQTVVPGIYAVGDVTNRVNLTPMAIREGHAFADTVFGGTPRSVDHTLVPTAVFTTPEAGVVGLTEAQALERHPRLDVYRSSFRPLKATLSGHPGKVLLKLLVDRDTDRVVGFHAVGPDTGEMAQLMGVALQLQATKAALDATLAVHPTAAEELVTMRTPAVRHNL